MKVFTLINILFIFFVLETYTQVPPFTDIFSLLNGQQNVKDETIILSKQGFLLEANNMTCLTTANVTEYKYDLWYKEYKHNPKYNEHLICCNEPFSSDTQIPSLGLKEKSSLDIIKMDFDVLTSGKTNCSIYYGHWWHGDIPSTAFIPIRGTTLTIHPVTIKTLLG